MPRSTLPRNLIRDYWQRTRDWLVQHHGFTPTGAATAVRRFRVRIRPAGDTIYNADPERVADNIALQNPTMVNGAAKRPRADAS